MKSHRAGVLRNLSFQTVAQLSSYAVSFTLMPLVFKTAGAGVYGSFILIGSVITLALQVFSLGAGYKCRRSLPAANSAAERTALFLPSASFQLITHAVTALVLLLAYPLLHGLLFKQGVPLSCWLVAIIVFSFYLNNLSDDYFRYTHRIGLISAATIVRSVLYPLLVVLLVLWIGRTSVNLLFTAQSLAYIVPALYVWWLLAREVPLSFRLDSVEQHWWDIRLGFPLAIAVLVESLLAVSDRYIMVGVLSPAYVGAYAAASAIGMLILVFPKVATSVLTSAMSHAVDAGHPEEAQMLLNRTLMLFLMISVPFVVGSVLLARPILMILANAEVAEMGRWVVPLVAIGSVIYGYTYFVFNALFVQMDTKLWFRANCTAAITSVALNILLLPIFRRIEVAAAILPVSYAVSAFMIERSRSRAWPIRIDPALLGKSLAAAGGMAVGVGLLEYRLGSALSPMATVAIQASVGVGLYTVILWMLSGVRLGDIRRLREAFGR